MLQMGRLVLRKNINGHARLFNKTAINFFHNYIPNEYTAFNEKDLPWLSDHVRVFDRKKECSISEISERWKRKVSAIC